MPCLQRGEVPGIQDTLAGEDEGMSSKRARRRRVCERKRRYSAVAQAYAAARAMWTHKQEVLTVYRCDYCGLWHIGHAPWRVRQSLAAQAGARP